MTLQPPRAPRPDRGNDLPVEPASRADAILHEAAKLFATVGYRGASMQDLAAAVGITKSSLYHFFPDKDAIFERVVVGATENHVAAAEAARASSPAAPVQVRNFCLAHARLLAQDRPRYVASALGHGDLKGQARERAALLREQYEACLRQMVEHGIASGEFRAVDPFVATRALLSCLNWMARWWNPQGPRSAEAIADDFVDLIVGGLAAPAARKRRPA